MKLLPSSSRGAALAIAFIASSLSAFAQSASTDPVGFITVNVAGGSAASPKLSLVSATLLHQVEWQGSATISGTTVSVTGAPWTVTPAQFGTNGQYFVEIASGTSPGAWTDIQSHTNGTLTTLDDLTAFAGATPTIRIRKHVKLVEFLGVNNSAGLQGGVDLNSSDEVFVYEGSTPAVYFYYDASDNGGVGAGWYTSSFQSAANATIAPNQGVVIHRKANTSVSFVAMGSVKTGNTLFPVSSGLNVLGTVSASGLTLATSGLYTGNSTTGVKPAVEQGLADEILMFSAGTPASFWYYDASDNGGVGAGWYNSSFQAAGSTSIPPGTSLVVTRKAPGAPFNWSVPSPSSF